MNNYGNMKDSLRRVAAYQQVEINHVPNYFADAYCVTVRDYNSKNILVRKSDVVEIKHDGQLNAVINRLMKEAIHSREKSTYVSGN